MVLAACGAGVGQLHKGHWGVSAWIASNYLANYDHEFLKRALWGELFTTIAPHPTPGWIDLAGSFLLLIAVLATALHVASSFERINRASPGAQSRQETWRRWFPALALCPALFLQFGYDLGRLDQLNLVGFILSIWLARSRDSWIRFLIVPISIVAILIHEAYLVVHLPVVIGILMVESLRSSKSDRRSATPSRSLLIPILLLGSVTAALFVMTCGSANLETHARIRDAMRDAGFDATDTANSTTIWVYSLKDTIAQTFHRYSTLKGAVYTALFLSFGAAASWVYLRIVRGFDPPSRTERYLVLSPFVVVTLLFIGFDAGRWFAWMAVNQVFVVLYLIETLDDRRRAAALAMMPRRLGAAALLGPVGVASAFPLLGWIARSLIR